MPGFELSRLAREDLVEIGVFGAERWGDERSERYVSDVYDVFQRLADVVRGEDAASVSVPASGGSSTRATWSSFDAGRLGRSKRPSATRSFSSRGTAAPEVRSSPREARRPRGRPERTSR